MLRRVANLLELFSRKICTPRLPEMEVRTEKSSAAGLPRGWLRHRLSTAAIPAASTNLNLLLLMKGGT